MSNLIVLPAFCDVLGGTTVSLASLMKGFEKCHASDSVYLLVRKDSITEKYLLSNCTIPTLISISANSASDYLRQALRWVNAQPKSYPLLLDNCFRKNLQLSLLSATPALHSSNRRIYHFCHEAAISKHPLGNLSRKLVFRYLSPKAICNSQFTAQHIRQLMPDVCGVLYQPIDLERFNRRPAQKIPKPLEAILQSGAKLILTPSRISLPGIGNDKNLRSLIPLVSHLKSKGVLCHSVIIGEDISPNQENTQELLNIARSAGVEDRFTILPPTFVIEDYYKCADVVMTLAPREPFGLTVIEAIACGVPVVGSRTGGIGEILNHFAPEWTVDPMNPIEAAEAVLRVLDSAETPTVLEEANRWVEEQCSVTHYAREIMRLTGIAA